MQAVSRSGRLRGSVQVDIEDLRIEWGDSTLLISETCSGCAAIVQNGNYHESLTQLSQKVENITLALLFRVLKPVKSTNLSSYEPLKSKLRMLSH